VSRLQVIDLFGGAGGLTVGFHDADFETVLAVDLDRAAVDTYNANFGSGELDEAGHPDGPGVCKKIQDVVSFPDADVIVGGPPCQGFSLLGVQHRRVVEMTTGKILDEPRNRLWKEYLRIVRDVEPFVFVMENVPPLLKSAEFAARS
jgi:DNA (cytosine-5)-methyltransferase 1